MLDPIRNRLPREDLHQEELPQWDLFRRIHKVRPKAENLQLTHRTGLTLVEVLISLGILLVLATLSFLAGRWAFREAGLASCASRLRQAGAAMEMYAAGSDGLPPPLFSHAVAGPGDLRLRIETADAERFKAALGPFGFSNRMSFCPADRQPAGAHLDPFMPLDASIIGYSVGIDPWVDALSRKQIGLLTPRPLAELPAEAIFLADRLWSTDRERPGTFRSPHGPSLNALAWSGGIRRRTVAEWGPQS